MYAVISLQGHQYIVTEGDTLVVDKIDAENGSEIEVKEVLSVFDEKGENVQVGAPYLKAHVVCKVVEAKQGDKIRVVKFMRKNRYERTIGFRAQQTVLEIKKIHA